jgi:hypothetical protein
MVGAALQTENTWLRTPHYEVAALNRKLAGQLPDLKRALETGVCGYPDANRENFFDVELPTGWAYIHVRDENRTVYLIAHSRS